MNNLKRTLSLALAGVMTLGVMTVSASAAEFTDAADIDNTAAVNTMTALSIINGREDGSFDPNATVNRAEMAKMIAIALNGGTMPNLGLASQNIFTDVTADQWFAEPVNYCATLGIIAGRGDGTFDPSGKVTGWEAAKMMLVAMGYDSTIFGFTGANWNTNVDAFADSLTVGTADAHEIVSLYSDVAGQRALPLTRQDAAQLIYNGLNANTISKKITGIQNGAPLYSYDMYSGSLLKNKFKATTVKGTLIKSVYASEKWTYTIATSEGNVPVISTEDLSDLYMQNVIATYKTESGKNNAFGISAINSSVLASGEIGTVKIDAKNDTIDGYTYDSTTNVYAINGDSKLYAIEDTWGSNAWDAYNLIDNDGDGKVDVVVTYPTTVVKVTNVDGAKITAAGVTYVTKDAKSTENAATTEDEIAKNDWIRVTAVAGKSKQYTLSKIELTGELRVTGKDSEGKYTIDGTKYAPYNDVSLSVGSTYNFAIIDGKWLVGKNNIEAIPDTLSQNDVLYVTEINADNQNRGGSGLAGKYDWVTEARVYFADGTTQIVDVKNVNGKDIVKDKDSSSTYNVAADTLYSYSVKDGKYTLKSLSSTETLGYGEGNTSKTYATIGAKTELDSGKTTFADGGIFFVTYKEKAGDTNTVTKLLTGKQIKAWNNASAFAVTNMQVWGKKNSSNILELGYGKFTIGGDGTLPTASNPDVLYGYVTSTVIEEWDAAANDGKGATVYKFNVWNGTETVTYSVDSKDSIPAVGTIFSFKATENKIDSFEGTHSADDTNVFAVTAVAGTKLWAYNGTEYTYTLTDDTKVIYVKGNKDGGATGVETGTIKLATNKDSKYTANVRIVANDDNEIILIVVDTTNEIRTLKDGKYTETKTFSE